MYQGLNLGPLSWEHGVLATGLPGKSQKLPLSESRDHLECDPLLRLEFRLLLFTGAIQLSRGRQQPLSW